MGINLFEKQEFDNMLNRINSLDKNSKKKWGKLTHAQMLAHCSKVLELAINQYPKKLFIGKLIGKYILNKILANKGEFRKNARSTKKLFVENPSTFKEEKQNLIKLFKQFYNNGSDYFENKNHPFFGKLTASQWNELMYKHLNHHLSQFSA